MNTTLKLLAALLDYPSTILWEGLEHAENLLMSQGTLPAEQQTALLAMCRHLARTELTRAQEDYVACFDRGGRSLSLHLFEHVHGESRDRGQAMVDLRMAYHREGLEIANRELPDYLPLFVDFCAHLPEAAAREWLTEIAPILQTLHGRLRQRDSHYAAVPAALLILAGHRPDSAVPAEEAEDSLGQIDAEWAEPPVTFGGVPNCPTAAAGH